VAVRLPAVAREPARVLATCTRRLSPPLRAALAASTALGKYLSPARMHPTLVREPFHGDHWIYEEKYASWRMLAFKDGDASVSCREMAATTQPDSVTSRALSRSWSLAR